MFFCLGEKDNVEMKVVANGHGNTPTTIEITSPGGEKTIQTLGENLNTAGEQKTSKVKKNPTTLKYILYYIFV